MTVKLLTQFLVAECEAAGSTEFTEDYLAAAKAAMIAGGGIIAPLTSASVAGKNFTRNVLLTPAEVALACREALDLYNDAAGSSPLTFVDFGRIA